MSSTPCPSKPSIFKHPTTVPPSRPPNPPQGGPRHHNWDLQASKTALRASENKLKTCGFHKFLWILICPAFSLKQTYKTTKKPPKSSQLSPPRSPKPLKIEPKWLPESIEIDAGSLFGEKGAPKVLQDPKKRPREHPRPQKGPRKPPSKPLKTTSVASNKSKVGAGGRGACALNIRTLSYDSMLI